MGLSGQRARPGRQRQLTILLLAAAVLPAQAAAQGAGAWADARQRLERLGLAVQLFGNHTNSWRFRGGAGEDRDSFGHSGSYDLFVLAAPRRPALLRDTTALLHVKGQYDRSVNDDVSALSDPVDDADFGEAAYIDELWVQQAFLRDRVSLRAGFLEQQTVFDRNAFANQEDRQFLATFLDNNGVVPLPNGIGAVLVLRPLSWLEIAAGAADADNNPRGAGFDSAFDGVASLTGHFEAKATVRLAGRTGRYRAGAFIDGRRRRRVGAGPERRGRRGHWGAYLSFDQVLLPEREAPGQGLGVFARFGYADEDVNRTAWFWSAGLELTGGLPGRPADALGLGVYQAIASERYRDKVDSDFRRETGVELYYRISVRRWLDVTPDLQWIADPGGRKRTTSALIGSLRVRISLR